METGDTDAALVRAARGGDKAAFAVLLGRHRPMLVALCARMLRDPGLVEDAAQEAALQALLNLDRLRRAERFGAWLGGIGLNVCRRWLRERAGEAWSWEALQGGVLGVEPVDWRLGPDELAAEAELAARVRQAVRALPPGQRGAVMLFYLQGLTHAEAAAALGIGVGALKTRLHKARGTLRRQLWIAWKEAEMADDTANQLVEMRVADVRRAPSEEAERALGKYAVVLEEVGGARRFPIWIGAAEGFAMALNLEKVQGPRPMTYAFAAQLIEAAGGKLREAHVNKLVERTFYAVAVVDGPHGTANVDARPSDALNLALIAGVPIRVAAEVLEACSTNQADQPCQFYAEGTLGAAEIAKAGW